eukprot:10771156-Lingulodinium_polyedra.AAC.1
MTRSTKTARAHPGRMPDVGAKGCPSTPSMRRRLAAVYADMHRPGSQSETPARRSAVPTDPSDMRSKALL